MKIKDVVEDLVNIISSPRCNIWRKAEADTELVRYKEETG